MEEKLINTVEYGKGTVEYGKGTDNAYPDPLEVNDDGIEDHPESGQ